MDQVENRLTTKAHCLLFVAVTKSVLADKLRKPQRSLFNRRCSARNHTVYMGCLKGYGMMPG